MKKLFLILTMFVTLVTITSCSKDSEPVLSSLNSITSFKIDFKGVNESEVTYDLGSQITISVPFKTALTGLKPIIKVSDKAKVSPVSGEAMNFEDGKAKPFTVTAEDGTAKVYNVTINTRGEVGSGTQLKSVEVTEFFETTTTNYEYTPSNFISKYAVKTGDNTKEFVFVYDSKNQITALENKTDKVSTTYTYNGEGQLTKATTKKEADLIYTYTYTYDSTSKKLTEEIRVNEQNAKKTTYTYKYEKGNVIEETVGTVVSKATYDNKNNPYKGIYPAAYAAIKVGIQGVGQNNPLGGFADADSVTYTYNADGYPLTVNYTLFGTEAKKVLTYN